MFEFEFLTCLLVESAANHLEWTLVGKHDYRKKVTRFLLESKSKDKMTAPLLQRLADAQIRDDVWRGKLSMWKVDADGHVIYKSSSREQLEVNIIK